MKPSFLRNSSVLALFLVAAVATSQQAQRIRPGVSRPASPSTAPAASAAKRTLRTLAGSDTCPGTVISALPFNDVGDTTGATNSVNDVTGVACPHPLIPSPSDGGEDLVYSFTVGAGNNLTFTVAGTGSGYDPSIYVLSTCDDGTTCVGFQDTVPGNVTEVLNVAGLAPGTYFFYVDSDFPAGTAGSAGTYTLSVTGTFGAVATPTPTTTPVPTTTGTPSPSPTATLTPTASPSPTRTSTAIPTATLTPTLTGQGGPGAGPATPVPTLSGWVLAAFALALAAVAVFLTRRS